MASDYSLSHEEHAYLNLNQGHITELKGHHRVYFKVDLHSNYSYSSALGPLTHNWKIECLFSNELKMHRIRAYGEGDDLVLGQIPFYLHRFFTLHGPYAEVVDVNPLLNELFLRVLLSPKPLNQKKEPEEVTPAEYLKVMKNNSSMGKTMTTYQLEHLKLMEELEANPPLIKKLEKLNGSADLSEITSQMKKVLGAGDWAGLPIQVPIAKSEVQHMLDWANGLPDAVMSKPKVDEESTTPAAEEEKPSPPPYSRLSVLIEELE